MSQFRFIDLQNTVWREGDPPLAGNDGPPVPEPPAPRPLSIRRAVCYVWYLLFVAFCLALLWTLLTGEPVSSPLVAWPETPLGLALGGALCAVTLLLRRWAR